MLFLVGCCKTLGGPVILLGLILRRIIVLLVFLPALAGAETSHMILESGANTTLQLTVYM